MPAHRSQFQQDPRTIAPAKVGAFLVAVAVVGPASWGLGAEPETQAALQKLGPAYSKDILPLVARYCHECHSADRTEADIDLTVFKTMGDIHRQPRLWQKVGDMLDSGQMPPKDARQPTPEERTRLHGWVRELLTIEAAARAGDPGPVVLRRLNNAEYTYSLRDLTGVASLDPAREFPVDSAAGEGFTNVGNALVMSPPLLTKYVDAGKEVASHLVLLPDGVRFSPHRTRRDWTNECLTRIRDFYAEFSGDGGGSAVNLQGIQFETNQGGRLPLERYLAATLEERDALAARRKTLEEVARPRRLSAKYLTILWNALNNNDPQAQVPPLRELRARWRSAGPQDAPAMAKAIVAAQGPLWKFNSIGHIGRVGGPTSWMEPVSPLVASQELRVKLPTPPDGQDILVVLASSDAGDGKEQDFLVWQRPRLVAPGRPDLLLRDVGRVTRELTSRRDRLFAQAAACLEAAHEAMGLAQEIPVLTLARKHGVEADVLSAWLDYLGIATGGPVALGTPMTRKTESSAGYDFIQGWVGNDALSVVANSSDQAVRIPGNMKPHSVAVHPAPTLSVAVGWRSPAAATLRIEALVQHAHPECGNGVAWTVELRRGNTRQRLAAGVSEGAKVLNIGPIEKIVSRAGDVVSLVVNPRDGNHSCDLTAIDLTINDGTRQWNLARDVSPNILAGNPHPDSHGNAGIWHFYSEPASGTAGHVIPAGSLLAQWQSAAAEDKSRLAKQLEQLLRTGPAGQPANAPDVALYRQLTSLSGPFMTAALQALAAKPADVAETGDIKYGLVPSAFGKHPQGGKIDEASLCVQAPQLLEVRLPADLVAGAELVTTAQLDPATGKEGSVQVQVTAEKRPDDWTAVPILTADGSAARRRFETALHEFRQLFPPALCYTKIVPVDEVVTLTLYYREDDQLRRLMLTDEQAARLDRLWDELLYVAREPLELVTAFEQISEFATQDRPDLVKAFAPLRQPILDRAAAFRQRLTDTQPRHVDAVLELAAQAYRRPLTEPETRQLRDLYVGLRQQEIPHEEAITLLLTRVLVAPAFLYRSEKPGPGEKASPVSDWELASRLSYFLWSSLPDSELRSLAAAGRLNDPETLVAQARRMLKDPKARRLATEFACHWLHIHDFDQHNEKSERHFPTFAALRGAMYEESVQFFAHLFQDNASVLDLIDADYTFLNEDLAKHYNIPGVTGPEWRRVEGVKRYARGGIFTQATTLAKQSGASRTSPILRGNWISEVVLGEKLPKPPKNVPQLPETAPEGLTERQLIERHSIDEGCIKCHARIDPFGFALENFDAIGRFREKDAGGLPIDAKTVLPDGTKIDGVSGLRDYVLTKRREAFLRQFHRKLLGYALGRAIVLSDEPLLAEMRATLDRNQFQTVPLMEMIVRSPQFRQIRGRDFHDEE